MVAWKNRDKILGWLEQSALQAQFKAEELERQRQDAILLEVMDRVIETLKASQSTPIPIIGSQQPWIGELDAGWRRVITHPAVILILGKRGSGKSALGYRLLELFRYGPRPYVVGVPNSARRQLPDWIGIVATLDDVPPKSIALVDEAYLHYHARGSMAHESKVMSQELNLSRQREQSLIFVSQEARQVDKNIVSSASVVVFKDLGALQLEFDRPELTKIATLAKDALASVKADRRQSFVYSPDADFLGLLQNNLPSFWKPSLSRLFAAGDAVSTSKVPKKMTTQEKAEKAKEMREGGASYGEIALVLGVTRGTVVNYVRGYLYRK